MRRAWFGWMFTVAVSSLVGCGSETTSGSGGTAAGGAGGAGGSCPSGGSGGSNIEHVVLIVQENHTFDSYFGAYCTAAPGSNPTCTEGPACCEAAPAKEPSGAAPILLDDAANAAYDPDHSQSCELAEMNGGLMDRYVTGVDGCSSPANFAVAQGAAKIYQDYASKYALADRNFQPLAGKSSANDMYFAVAKKVFDDNLIKPDTIGADCDLAPLKKSYDGQTIFDVLGAAGKTYGVYAEGYDRVKAAAPGDCATAPKDCGTTFATYPCIYTPSDIPFLYFKQFAQDEAKLMRDYTNLAQDIASGALPNVAFIKLVGYHTEHPGLGTTISEGAAAVAAIVDQVEASCYAKNTLVLIAWDEGGGYFDHVKPPPDSAVDVGPYGTRVPLLAIGRFARKNSVSHVDMEHSSVVKFLELNFTGATGQLQARDAVVNNIGSLLDPKETGINIPDQ